jgi:hypothetical protein
MASLSPKISFDVHFLLGGYPTIQLTVVTSLTSGEQPNFKGHFSITQPDGINEIGSYDSPQVSASSLVFTKQLRLSSNQEFQRGQYSITLFADHPDYTPGTFTRQFNFTYNPVTLKIVEQFDVFTPLLAYTDSTVYTKGNYSILSQASLWNATCVAGAISSSVTSSFNLAINGIYYDCTYNTTYDKTVIYSHSSDTWLSIQQTFSYDVISKAFIPQTSTTLLSYLTALKTAKDAQGCNKTLNDLYEKASVLYQHIRNKVCARATDKLKEYFEEFYRLTHNYQPYVYVNTNAVIAAYDFTTGCGGGSSSSLQYTFRSEQGVTFFDVEALAGKTITAVVRSGLSKGIANATTADTEYLQIVGNRVTLPTGDITNTIVLPNGNEVGELFIFTYV